MSAVPCEIKGYKKRTAGLLIIIIIVIKLSQLDNCTEVRVVMRKVEV